MRTSAILSVLALLGLATAGRAQGPIGFVNLERVFEAHPAYQRVLDEATREREAKEQELREKAKALQTAQEDLDLLKEGSEMFLAQLKDIKKQAVELELDGRLAAIQYNLRLIERMQLVFKQTKEVVAEVAKKKGLRGVANVSDRKIVARELREYEASIARLNFAWVDPTHDLTSEASKLVIERYK